MVSMDLTFLLFFFPVLSVILYFILLHASQRNGPRKLPPGPLPLPILGSLLKLGEKPHQSLAKLAKVHGPLMTLKLGYVPTVVASSVTMAKEVLQRHDQALAGRTVADAVRALQYCETTMAWLPPNPHWRKLRMICNTQMFTTHRLDSNQALRHQKVQELVSHLQQQREVNIGMVTFVTVLNLISNTIFSVDLVLDIGSDSVQEFKEAVRGIMDEAGRPNFADYFPFLRVLDPQRIRRRMTCHFKKLYALFDRLIEERLGQRAASPDSNKRNDFLDVLLDYSNDNSFKLRRQDIKNLLVEIFSAGSDTTSSTLEWAMAELLRHPEAMAKVRSELEKTLVSGQSFEESDIAKLPYLQAVVKETLRLHPPVPLLIPRRAETTVEISGFTIPRNTQLFVNSWAIGRDEENWSEPLRFWPERFLRSNIDFRGRDLELIPFGAGRRICPGMPLAARMVHLILASLIQSFDWKLPSGMNPDDIDMEEKFGITLQMAKPLRAIPVARTSEN
ncbi:hypothetical protein H6P81_012086 [Aristolochia fimbriata]|uniref:Cytochrome P450 n=1 Tax=Aristolochia fimbriata TaxID=158543 RepID=A0AAV7EAX9_ARIFI|nr:hypothetical protein H6P81_012086 [Aristolochia fimbriata]